MCGGEAVDGLGSGWVGEESTHRIFVSGGAGPAVNYVILCISF